MKTLKVYFDDSNNNYQIITPTEQFYRDSKGEVISPDWSKLAWSLYPGYHKYEVY